MTYFLVMSMTFLISTVSCPACVLHLIVACFLHSSLTFCYDSHIYPETSAVGQHQSSAEGLPKKQRGDYHLVPDLKAYNYISLQHCFNFF